MFGVSRKKSKPARVRSVASSPEGDDVDDDAAVRRRVKRHERRKEKVKGEKKTKMTTAAPPMLSFDPDEGSSDEDYSSLVTKRKSKKREKHSKHRKKAGGGLGYGGVGAMHMNASSDGSASEGERERKDEGEEDNNRGGGSCYNAAALRELRGEQKLTTRVKDDATRPEPVDSPTEDERGATKSRGKMDNTEDDFISLLGRTHERTKTSHDIDPVVLTGDEAMALAEREEGENDVDFDPHGLFSPPTPPPPSGGTAAGISVVGEISDGDVDGPSADVEEGNRRWEDTMARRAGVLPPNTATTDGNDSRARPKRNSSHHQASLGKIRASLQPAILNLENVYSDLETGISRHRSTLSSARDELTRNKSTLQKHGKALEYYQGLRVDLAMWMGALRELNVMVVNVEEARRLLEADITWTRMERFLEWGRDCTEVLEKRGLLRNKVAESNDDIDVSGSVQAAAHTDEFGRDLSSMSSIARVKRWSQRQKRCLKRLQDSKSDNEDLKSSLKRSIECSNDDNFDVAEIEEWKQRHDAVNQAIAFIPNLVKDDYLSISNLCSLFFDWERMYPDDYANCYAEISIIRMIEVLAKLELCEKWDVLNLNGRSSTEYCLEITDFKWVQALKMKTPRVEGNEGVGDPPTKSSRLEVILLEVVKKEVVGRLLDAFLFQDGIKGGTKQHGIYDLFSESQTKFMCSILKSIFAFFLKCSQENARIICEEIAEKVLSALLLSLRYYIGKLPVPIVDASQITVVGNEFAIKDGSLDGEVSDAIAYATITQVKELCTLVTNILGHWYPIINEQLHHQQDKVDPLVRVVFVGLVSLRILPALHSSCIMSGGSANDKTYSELPKKFISEFSDTMTSTGLLDKDEWMLITAPLRAAVEQWKDN
ncbi:hypothetical protein ACHAW5_002152 [Stephanodiscus triporus]|uniref:Exocyst complex component Sec6 n=1 Tax=Stephanodiscus triporus TaxID=2934178 RepID=A0ABD3Q3R7_9STRA